MSGRSDVRGSVLVVAYYFPPMGLSGVLRISKFTKYLVEEGWRPTVLTVGDVGYFAHDYSLLDEVLEAGVTIERTRTVDPLSIAGRRRRLTLPTQRSKRLLSGVTHVFLQPDNKIGWKKHAIRRADELFAREHFDVIFATAPPFTSLVIGAELQRRHGVPLVVDYRDPWLDNRQYFYATPLHRRYAAGLEESVLKRSERVVVVNRRIKEQLVARYPFLTHGNVEIIPSGYDPADLRRAARFPLEPPRRSGGGTKMRITFSGIIDGARSPRPFFEGVARLFAEHPETRDEIELLFVGTFHERYARLATQLGIGSSIVTTGYLEHLEAVRHLLASDLLWLSSHDHAITPGKLHEYIGTRRPILALVPEGVVRQVLADHGASWCVGPTDVPAIADAIFEAYMLWKKDELPRGEEELAREYDQRHLVGRLSRLLSHAVRIH